MKTSKILLCVTLFSIAMGFLESSVVIYLRQLYYPGGFSFPLMPMPPQIASVEVCREAATILMLLAVGWLAGSALSQRLAWFMYSFAIWDIFYYVFLYIFLGWPQSLLTWDILFLLPVPWVGPVLAPVIVSVTLILYALSALRQPSGGRRGTWRISGLLLTAGSILVLYSFVSEYIQYSGSRAFPAGENNTIAGHLAGFQPQSFNWLVFSCGEAIMLIAIVALWATAFRFSESKN